MTDEERRRRRREEHRRTWLEMMFDEMPADVDAAVTRMWAAGETSTSVACEIVDTDPAGLRVIAKRLGIPITRANGGA